MSLCMLPSRTVWWSRHGPTFATEDLTAVTEGPRLAAAGVTVQGGYVVSPGGAQLEPSRTFGDFQFKVLSCSFYSF